MIHVSIWDSLEFLSIGLSDLSFCQLNSFDEPSSISEVLSSLVQSGVISSAFCWIFAYAPTFFFSVRERFDCRPHPGLPHPSPFFPRVRCHPSPSRSLSVHTYPAVVSTSARIPTFCLLWGSDRRSASWCFHDFLFFSVPGKAFRRFRPASFPPVLPTYFCYFFPLTITSPSPQSARCFPLPSQALHECFHTPFLVLNQSVVFSHVFGPPTQRFISVSHSFPYRTSYFFRFGAGPCRAFLPSFHPSSGIFTTFSLFSGSCSSWRSLDQFFSRHPVARMQSLNRSAAPFFSLTNVSRRHPLRTRKLRPCSAVGEPPLPALSFHRSLLFHFLCLREATNSLPLVFSSLFTMDLQSSWSPAPSLDSRRLP